MKASASIPPSARGYSTSHTPTAHSLPGGQVITNIQAVRGIASLMVFLGHSILLHPGMGFDWLAPFMGPIASSGVDIFFVISGFIIATVAVKSGSDTRYSPREIAWNFTVKRLTRIYPVFWIVMALALPLARYVEFSPSWIEHSSNLRQFFLVTHVNSHIMAAWSLGFEVYFYAIVAFALLIWPRRVMAVLAIWSVASISVILYGTYFGGPWVGAYPVSPMVLEFVFGMLIAWLISKRVFSFAVTSAVLGAICFIVGLEVLRLNTWYSLGPWWRTIYSGVPSAFLIYGIVALEMKRGWKFAPFWSKFGDASYSIYIWHQFLLYSMLTICEKAGLLGRIPGPLLLGIWMAIALWVGFLSYRYIEIPIQNASNGHLIKRAA